MGSKLLVGAVVGAFLVCLCAWTFVKRDPHAESLAAPGRSEPKPKSVPDALDPAHPQRRAEALDPESEALAQPDENVPEPLAPRAIARLIADLRDDDVAFNAESALWSLTYAGPEVIAPLEDALASRDRQQRLLVGYLLGRKREVKASPALARVLLESFEESEPHIRVTADLHDCAFRRFSCDRALFEMVENRISLGLNSDEPLARIESAFLFAKQHSELARRRVLVALLGALEDNQVRGDARLGLRGLVCLGDEAREALENAWPGRDAQQRALIGHLLSKLSPAHGGAHALTPWQLGHLGFPQGDPLHIREPEL